LRDQLLGLFGKQRPVGRRVNDHRFQLLAQHATLGVDLGNRHQGHVLQHGFRDGHGARQAVQDAHLDGVGGLGPGGQADGGHPKGDGAQLLGEGTTIGFH